MENIIANITSYIGISAGAVHFYCRFKELSQVELCEMLHAPYDRLYGATINGSDLLRKVTEKDAEKLTKSPMEILDMVKCGTIRFDSVHQITEELRRQFPDHNLIITENESVQDYVSSMLHEEHYRLFDELTREQQDTVIHHFVENRFERYNDYYKRQEFMAYILRNKKEGEFVYVVKDVLKSGK